MFNFLMNNLIFVINFIFVLSLFHSLILVKCTACILIFNLHLGITNTYLGLVGVYIILTNVRMRLVLALSV